MLPFNLPAGSAVIGAARAAPVPGFRALRVLFVSARLEQVEQLAFLLERLLRVLILLEFESGRVTDAGFQLLGEIGIRAPDELGLEFSVGKVAQGEDPRGDMPHFLVDGVPGERERPLKSRQRHRSGAVAGGQGQMVGKGGADFRYRPPHFICGENSRRAVGELFDNHNVLFEDIRPMHGVCGHAQPLIGLAQEAQVAVRLFDIKGIHVTPHGPVDPAYRR